MNIAATKLMIEVLTSELTQDLGMPPEECEQQRNEIDNLQRELAALGNGEGLEE